MVRTALVLTMAALVAACGDDAPSQPERVTKRALTKAVLEALKADDFSALKAHLVTPEDMRAWGQRISESLGDQAAPELRREMQEMQKSDPAAFEKRVIEPIRRSFKSERADVHASLRWAEATFDGFDEESSAEIGDGRQLIAFRTRSGDSVHGLRFLALDTSAGWRLVGRLDSLGPLVEAAK